DYLSLATGCISISAGISNSISISAGMWRMAHFPILSSQTNSDLFLNLWCLWWLLLMAQDVTILHRFVYALIPCYYISEIVNSGSTFIHYPGSDPIYLDILIFALDNAATHKGIRTSSAASFQRLFSFFLFFLGCRLIFFKM
ncbi:hypothetical protein ACJX0J_033435, partial [Zea mays]